MVRNIREQPEPLTETELTDFLFRNTVDFKNKSIDLDTVITRANIKKYITLEKINNKSEQLLKVINKVINKESLTSDEDALYLESQTIATEYLADASEATKDKLCTLDDNSKLKNIISSFKYKFSMDSFEVITHIVNLFIREIALHSLESCLANKLRVVQPNHIPWDVLQSKLTAGIYFNTSVVYNEIHSVEDDEEIEEVEEEEVEETEEVVDNTEGEDETVEESVVEETSTEGGKIRLRQYISTMFKALCSSEPRFKDLKLSKKLTLLLNDLIYNVLDRYSNILKSLLNTTNSKTVNGKFSLIATKILLQDHIHSDQESVNTILDVVQDRLERLHEAIQLKRNEREGIKSEEVKSEVQPTEDAVSKKKTKKSIK
jgi:hypothetical protein